jgi:hypothetical protein
MVSALVAALIVVRLGVLYLDLNRQHALIRALLDVTEPLVAPFRGAVGPDPIVRGHLVEVAGLVALAIWASAAAVLDSARRLVASARQPVSADRLRVAIVAPPDERMPADGGRALGVDHGTRTGRRSEA